MFKYFNSTSFTLKLNQQIVRYLYKQIGRQVGGKVHKQHNNFLLATFKPGMGSLFVMRAKIYNNQTKAGYYSWFCRQIKIMFSETYKDNFQTLKKEQNTTDHIFIIFFITAQQHDINHYIYELLATAYLWIMY